VTPERLTPERLAEINALAQGDPWVIGRELVKVVNAQEAEIERLAAQVAELEDAVPARIAAEMDLDEARGLACAYRTAYQDECPTDDLGLLLPDWLAGTTQTITTVTKETVSE
jgi:hypothetical protein